jgi:hypothetical protein
VLSAVPELESEQQIPAAGRGCDCPGSKAQLISRSGSSSEVVAAQSVSALAQWPVQIKLVPVQAPYFTGAHLLIAADCAAYARATFHAEFMQGRVTLIGCPKLDGVDYAEKLREIFTANSIVSVTVVRMEVPCCAGIEHAVRAALAESGAKLPCRVVTLGTDGVLRAEEEEVG